MIIAKSSLLAVDRSPSFDLADIIVGNFSVYQRKSDYPWYGWSIQSQDENSNKILVIDVSKLRFFNMLQKCETCIPWKERLRRRKEVKGSVCLDVFSFRGLYAKENCFPETWKNPINGRPRRIFCDATVLRGRDDQEYVIFFYYNEDEGRWYYSLRWTRSLFDRNDVSAMIPSST